MLTNVQNYKCPKFDHVQATHQKLEWLYLKFNYEIQSMKFIMSLFVQKNLNMEVHDVYDDDC